MQPFKPRFLSKLSRPWALKSHGQAATFLALKTMLPLPLQHPGPQCKWKNAVEVSLADPTLALPGKERLRKSTNGV